MLNLLFGKMAKVFLCTEDAFDESVSQQKKLEKTTISFFQIKGTLAWHDDNQRCFNSLNNALLAFLKTFCNQAGFLSEKWFRFYALHRGSDCTIGISVDFLEFKSVYAGSKRM